MIFLNRKSTDQTESLGGGATTLSGGTPDTGSGPFRLNFIAAYNLGLYGLVLVGAVPSQAPRRGGIRFKRFYDIALPLMLDSRLYCIRK